MFPFSLLLFLYNLYTLFSLVFFLSHFLFLFNNFLNSNFFLDCFVPVLCWWIINVSRYSEGQYKEELHPPPSRSVFIESSICYQCCWFLFIFCWKRGKECNDSTKHFNEGSHNILQEFENLLNSRINSLGRFIVCIITHVCMCEHTTCTLEAAPRSSSKHLSSPNLTLPQRQTKPPL